MRLLILIAGIIMLVYFFRSLLPPPPRDRRRRDNRGNEPEKMVSCAHCRLYLPESEAMDVDGDFFCNREHYRAWLEDLRARKH
jgi:uncharacterized protein